MDINSELVRKTRVERGWTQQQLAEIADLSLRTVQRVENQSAASNETVSSLCAVLELDREQLLEESTRPEVQRALRRLEVIVPMAVGLGVALGSGVTVAVMLWMSG
ncbi:MAG: helix-turn-helix transcriptional regulator [Pseudomonadota bacterium]